MGWRKSQRQRGFVSEAGSHGSKAVAAHPLDGGTVPKGYSPQNVGNDASARPWETVAAGFEPSDSKSPSFDVDAFLQASKANFLRLQEAWDRSDVSSLRAMMTETMLEQIQTQLGEREKAGAASSHTEIVLLEAQLLTMDENEHRLEASVEFSGLIREDASSGPNPFREVWNITRPKDGQAGWLVSGVQAFQ